MLTAAIYIKLIAEIALLALAGQWLLGLFAGARKEQNFFYKSLQTIGSPFTRLARLVSPRFVPDRHVPLVAFLLLVIVWLAATIYKVQTCVQIGLELCK